MEEARDKPDLVTVDIASSEQLLSGNVVDPFPEEFDVVSGMSRIVEAAGARSDPGCGVSRLVIRLPGSQVGAGSEARMGAAIKRYCRAQAEGFGRRVPVPPRRQGYQSLVLGPVFPAACVLASLLLEFLFPDQSPLGRLPQSGLVF